jgi:RimJ/RimL family protein N-acetyltransferase
MLSPTITIVPISLQHVAGFHACLDGVARERRYLAQLQAPPLAEVEAFVRENLAEDKVQFVALEGEQVVGWADAIGHWPAAMRHGASVGMGVLASHRGRGIGQGLLEACIDKAWAQGFKRIELQVRCDNLRAIALYERLGFVHEGRKRSALCIDGVYGDAFFMALLHPSLQSH